jgi:hypothetical protein
MRYANLILIAFLIITMIGIGACNTDKSHSKASAKSTDVSDLLDESESHFQKAHESFLKKDMKTAVAEIRKDAAFIKLETSRASDESKKGLIASANELDKLADDVEKGTVSSAKDLENAFARASYALTKHHYIKSTELTAKNDTVKAGKELKAAADDFEHAIAWTGSKVEAGTDSAIKGARLATGKMMEGIGAVSDDASKAMKDIGTEIENFGKKIVP